MRAPRASGPPVREGPRTPTPPRPRARRSARRERSPPGSRRAGARPIRPAGAAAPPSPGGPSTSRPRPSTPAGGPVAPRATRARRKPGSRPAAPAPRTRRPARRPRPPGWRRCRPCRGRRRRRSPPPPCPAGRAVPATASPLGVRVGEPAPPRAMSPRRAAWRGRAGRPRRSVGAARVAAHRRPTDRPRRRPVGQPGPVAAPPLVRGASCAGSAASAHWSCRAHHVPWWCSRTRV